MSISIDLDLPVDPSNGKRCNIARIVSGGGGGDPLPGLLPAGYFAPARAPLAWENPNGNEGLRSASNWAHSQFNWQQSFTVEFGSPPYIFYLTNPVAGVSVIPRAPERNQYLYLWCDVVIDRAEFQSGTKTFELNCMDQNGTVISLEKTVTLDDDKFVFARKGSAGGDGTHDAPFDDLIEIYTTSDADATHAGKVLMLREGGTFTATNFDTDNAALAWNLNKPSAILNYPGETWVIDADVNIILGESAGSGFNDYYIRGGQIINSIPVSMANRKIFALFGSHERVIIENVQVIEPFAGTVGTDNEACVYTANNGFDSHVNLSIINLSASGLPSSPNGFALVDFYGVSHAVVLGGRVTGSVTGQGMWLKARNQSVMLAGVDYYEESGQTVDRVFYPNQADSGLLDPPGIVQFLACKGYRSADGLFAQSISLTGDSNQAYGIVIYDRCVMVGGVRDGGDDAPTLGEATFYGCIIINDLADKIPIFATSVNNITASRSSLRTYLETDGNTVSTLPQYGQVGSTFIQAEAA